MNRPDADQARVAAAIETRLQEIQEEERHARVRNMVVGYAVTAFFTTTSVANEFGSQSHDSRILERAYLLAITGTALALTLREQLSTSATNKVVELWRKDPRHRPLDLTLAPLAGGGTFVVSGSF
jgi:hypothetical protein